MVRSRILTFVLALLLVVPAAASAQKDSQFTREASKYLGLGMANPDRAARHNLYAQALVHLRQGMERDAENAKVWLMAGTVLAGLGQMREADEAWKKAQQMHSDYAEEISEEREAAWVDAFSAAMEAMDEQKYDEAITILENSEIIFSGRPEALMNLGALYANAGNKGVQGDTVNVANAKAQDAFRRAHEATKSDLFDELTDEQKAEWLRFRELALLNIAQIYGAMGVEAFQVGDYAGAAAEFVKAAEINPHSRDYVFNHAQSLWAQVSQLEDSLEGATPEAAAPIKAKLSELYAQVEVLARKSREFDPGNGNIYLIEARSVRQRGEFVGTDEARAAASQEALKLLTAREALPALVDGIAVQQAAEGAIVSGTLTANVTSAGTPASAAGEPVTLTITLLGSTGQSLGEATVTVNAPAADAEAPFEVTTTVTNEIAGWKYTIAR